MKEIPKHIKEITNRDSIEFECICGSSAVFDYPLQDKQSAWWFKQHENCPNTEEEKAP